MSTFCPPTPVETRSILVAKVQVGIRESHESPGPGVGTGDMGGGSLAHDPGIRLAQGHRDRALQHRLLCGWNSSIDGCYLAADSAQVLTSEKAALSASLAQIRVRVALWALTAALTRHGHRDKRRRRTPRQRPRRLCVGSLPSCFKYQSQQCIQSSVSQFALSAAKAAEARCSSQLAALAARRRRAQAPCPRAGSVVQ